jgi:hypothetical protein
MKAETCVRIELTGEELARLIECGSVYLTEAIGGKCLIAAWSVPTTGGLMLEFQAEGG